MTSLDGTFIFNASSIIRNRSGDTFVDGDHQSSRNLCRNTGIVIKFGFCRIRSDFQFIQGFSCNRGKIFCKNFFVSQKRRLCFCKYAAPQFDKNLIFHQRTQSSPDLIPIGKIEKIRRDKSHLIALSYPNKHTIFKRFPFHPILVIFCK